MLNCVSYASCFREAAGVFDWFCCHMPYGRRQTMQTNCLSVNQPAFSGPDCWEIEKSALTLLYVSSVQVGALNGSCIAYKCEVKEWMVAVLVLFPHRSPSYTNPPVIWFILNNLSHCISAGGSNVALCITLKVHSLIPETASQCGVCVCAWKAPCPWVWHQIPITIPAHTGK